MLRIISEIQSEMELVNIDREDKKKMGIGVKAEEPKPGEEPWQPLAVVPEPDTSKPRGLTSLIQPPKGKQPDKRVDKA